MILILNMSDYSTVDAHTCFLSATALQEQSACEKAVQEAGGAAALLGAYVPQCDDVGKYKPLQFHASIGHSWCVTREGTEIPGTRTTAGKLPPDCQPFSGRNKFSVVPHTEIHAA